MKKPVDGTPVELVGGPGHEDVGCMALKLKKRMKDDGTNTAPNTGFSSILVTGQQLSLSNEPVVRSALTG